MVYVAWYCIAGLLIGMSAYREAIVKEIGSPVRCALFIGLFWPVAVGIIIVETINDIINGNLFGED